MDRVASILLIAVIYYMVVTFKDTIITSPERYQKSANNFYEISEKVKSGELTHTKEQYIASVRGLAKLNESNAELSETYVGMINSILKALYILTAIQLLGLALAYVKPKKT